jgi:hypothetical protein
MKKYKIHEYFVFLYTAQRAAKSWTLPVVLIIYILTLIAVNEDRHTVVSIATRYGLDGPGTESQQAWDSSLRSSWSCTGAHPAFCTGILPGVKQQGRGVDHQPHLAPKLKKE